MGSLLGWKGSLLVNSSCGNLVYRKNTNGQGLPKPSLQMPTHPVRLLPRNHPTFLVPSMATNLQFVVRWKYWVRDRPGMIDENPQFGLGPPQI